MLQCVDILKNFEKYNNYSVRTPKGLILEGPPGNGKTMLAKGFAGEANVNFIAVSGAEFQDKYIGVGSSKVRELFKLATQNKPCVIFIDEIDALARKRNDGDNGGNAERDNTLNQLLIEIDGFYNNSGIFIIGATNRIDLLDSAFMRPGRIDKSIYVGMPDTISRRYIINIHIKGKPNSLTEELIDELVLMTSDFSGAQIENLLNEAMLYALRKNKTEFNISDIDIIYNRILSGSQSEEHIINDETLERICVHEMGHSVMGLFCKHHPLMKKVVINLNSPKNPGMTIFDYETNDLDTYENLYEYISILYGGRIAELLIYGDEFISTGASSDYAEARKTAQEMIIHYGMGNKYGGIGENSKNLINDEIEKILNDAYKNAYNILNNKKDCIISGSLLLKKQKSLTRSELQSHLMI
jgi:cell division protease FtsH